MTFTGNVHQVELGLTPVAGLHKFLCHCASLPSWGFVTAAESTIGTTIYIQDSCPLDK